MSQGPGATSGYAGLIGTGVSTVVDAFSSYTSAKATKQNYEFEANMRAYDARLAEIRAADRQAVGNEQLFRLKIANKQAIGSARARIAAKGGADALGSGSHLYTLQDMKWQVTQAEATHMSNTQKEVFALRHNALGKAFAGEMARIKANQVSPLSAAATSFAEGATKFSKQWFRLNPPTPEKEDTSPLIGTYEHGHT